MTLRERALAVGIDPDDPKYERDPDFTGFTIGDVWCPWCSNHGQNRPRVKCDVQQAEYALMDPATRAKCFRCFEPFTLTATRLLCPRCAAVDAAEAVIGRRSLVSNALRADDGCGCVERVHPVERDIYPERFCA